MKDTSSVPLKRDPDRFKYFYPEQIAVIPEGFRAPLEVKSSLLMCRESENPARREHHNNFRNTVKGDPK